MATFVLVHGAWHGGWCWKKLTPLLRAAGHEVYTPTLTGLGERAHLLTRESDLDLHVRDVANVLDYEELTDVILVGHSYGGMVITGVAGRRQHRLWHLVYLDAVFPIGEARSSEELAQRYAPDSRAATKALIATQGEGWYVPPPAAEVLLGVPDVEDAGWLRAKLTAQPARTWTQRLEMHGAPDDALLRTYIRCTGNAIPQIAACSAHARGEGWRYRELATGHEAMITLPRETANLLLEIAALS